jgi:hypothetical protein
MRQDYARPVGQASGTELAWSGQAFDSYSSSDEDASCHQTVSGVTFKLYIPEYGEDATFDVPVPIELATYDGSTTFGVPMGSYALPENIEIVSSTPPGKYAARGGLLRAICYDFTVHTGTGIRVEGGWHTWYDYTGQVYLHVGGTAMGGPGGGWAYATSDGFQNGMGDGDWGSALSTFMLRGTCTYGWEIWVDGTEKCNEYGQLMA